MSSPIHRIDRNTAGLVAFAVQLPAPPASSFSEQVLSQRQVSRTCEAIAPTLPGCLAALLRRLRAAAVCCTMSTFSPCTEAEGTPSSETRMARLAPPATAGAPPGLCRLFTGPPREFESHLALSGLRKRSRRPAAAQPTRLLTATLPGTSWPVSILKNRSGFECVQMPLGAICTRTSCYINSS